MLKTRNMGLRLLGLALALVCFVTAVRPTAVTATTEGKQQNLTTNVHYRGYYSSPVIGQMEDGTQITVLDETREFYKVDCYDMKGYIAKSQVVHTDDGKYYISCKSGSAETASVEYTDHAQALELRHALLTLAQKQLGSRYVYGSARPGAFDCSGLMYYLYAQYGIELNRTASAQMRNGIVVAKEGLQVGDLIFFREPGEYSVASHVGIYAGNNQIIHAGNRGVVYADLDFDYFARYYLCARRIVNTNAAKTDEIVETPAPAALTTIGGTGRRSN